MISRRKTYCRICLLSLANDNFSLYRKTFFDKQPAHKQVIFASETKKQSNCRIKKDINYGILNQRKTYDCRSCRNDWL